MSEFNNSNHIKCHAVGGPDELIHIDCASHTYPDGSIGIHNLCFRVLECEIVAICGANGSGKSTLIEHLNGLLLPTNGCISVMGRKVDHRSKRELWREVGIVFQHSDDQLFAPTVLDDVMFGPLNLGMTIDKAREAAMEALSSVEAVELAYRLPNYLSGGQKRLVAIAGILAMRPKIIALDEPTSDLDPAHAEIIEAIIRSFKVEHGISAVIATHDLDLAARLADRVCIVKGGAVIAEGRPEDIFYNKPLLESAGLRMPKIALIYQGLYSSGAVDKNARPVTLEALSRCFL